MSTKEPIYQELVDRIDRLEREIFQLRRSEKTSGKADVGRGVVDSALTAGKSRRQEHIERQRLEGVIEMAGAVCLELNQPLQALYFHCERLQKAISQDNLLYNQIDWIVKKVDSMAEIIKKLRSIARYQTKDYIEGTRIVDIDRASRPD